MKAPLPESILNPLVEVTACPTCGQIIAGLPPQGRCPECGGEYDRHEVVIFGKRRWHTWHLYGGLLTAGPFFLLSLASPHHALDWLASVVWGLTLLGILVAAINRLLVERPGHARLRLSRAGVGLDVETPPPPVLLRLLGTACRAVGVRWRWWPTDPWMRISTLPWFQVRGITVKPVKDQRFRIQVQRSGSAREKATPIDMTTSATTEQIDALRRFAAEFTQLA